MDELQSCRTPELEPEIVGQLVGYYHLLLAYEARGEDRFFDPFRHGREKQHFYVVERGVVISHADVSQRTLTHRGESYRLAGVGEVMTCPTFQHEGHGTRVVAAATDFILRSDADLAMLFTAPELSGFYQQSGWVPLPDLRVTFGDPAQPISSDEFVMMRFITERAQQHQADFEQGVIFVGASMW